jgi:hypothetical protein
LRGAVADDDFAAAAAKQDRVKGPRGRIGGGCRAGQDREGKEEWEEAHFDLLDAGQWGRATGLPSVEAP